LENELGEVLEKGIPLQQLKIIKKDDDSDKGPLMEIQKIGDDRTVKGVNEYLINWRGLSKKFNEWVKESDIETTEVISRY
jgi:hypothetical protein